MKSRMRILISLNVFLLSFIGLLFIYSAFSGQYDLLFKNPYAIKQMIFMIIGIVILNLFSGLDYNMVVRASKYFYWFGLIFLVLVLFVFPTVKGRWIRLGFISFQPSEFMKLIYILFISSVFNSYFKRRDKTYTFNIIKFIFKTGFLTFVPFFLILKQPDLGTSLVFIIIWLVILFFIGTGFYTILSITFFSVGAILGVFLRVSNEAFSSGKVVAYLLSSNFFHFLIIILLILFIVFLFYILFLLFTKIKVNIIKVSLLFFFLAAGFHFSSPIVQNLKQYQKSRITSFINPYSDLRGRGWHIIQSRIAVGSGGISGKGFLKGTQNKLNFLPERHTDFIFSLISEEFGFVGSFLVLFLEFLLLLFLYYTAIKSTSTLGFYISISTFILFLIHIFANIGMNLGVMPVIGMPLPFVSYGGSFYIVASILLGINVNIYSQQKNINKIGIFFNEENRR